jgi:flagellar protein FliO/FliZ
MEWGSVFQSAFALVFVLSLIGITSLLLRRFGQDKQLFAKMVKKTKNARLGIEEMMPLDARRRLVLVRRDDTEHLILLAPDKETVIETDIKMKKPARKH